MAAQLDKLRIGKPYASSYGGFPLRAVYNGAGTVVFCVADNTAQVENMGRLIEAWNGVGRSDEATQRRSDGGAEG